MKDPRADIYNLCDYKALQTLLVSQSYCCRMDGSPFSSYIPYRYMVVPRYTQSMLRYFNWSFTHNPLGKNASNVTIIFHFSDMATLYTFCRLLLCIQLTLCVMYRIVQRKRMDRWLDGLIKKKILNVQSIFI